MLLLVAVFSPDYIPGLIIEALNPRGKWISVKNTEIVDWGAQHVIKCPEAEVLIAFVQKLSLEEHLTLVIIILCFPLNSFSIVAWRKVEEEKDEEE